MSALPPNTDIQSAVAKCPCLTQNGQPDATYWTALASLIPDGCGKDVVLLGVEGCYYFPEIARHLGDV